MATPPKTPKKPKTQSKASAVKASGRLTLKALNDDLSAIEARLKKAESKTQRQVKALTDDFDRLANATHSHNADSRAALTDHVTALTQKLQSQMAANQRAVTEGLAQALSNPTLENLARAIDDANARLDQSEIVQRDAIASINRNISDLALAVDARLSHEEKTRMAAMAAMKKAQDSTETRLSRAIMETDERMMLRLSELEAENAKAMTQMGDKVVALAEDLNERAEDGEAMIKDRVNEIALSTQAELDSFKANLQRRLDALEDQIHTTDSHLNRSVNSLTSRIEGLEYGLTSAPVSSLAENSHYPTAPSLVETPRSDTAVPYLATDAEALPLAQPSITAPQDGRPEGGSPQERPVHHAYSEDAFSPDRPTPQAEPIAPPHLAVDTTLDTRPAATATPYQSQDYAAPQPMALTEQATSSEAVPYDPAHYATPSPAVPHNLEPTYEETGHNPYAPPSAPYNNPAIATYGQEAQAYPNDAAPPYPEQAYPEQTYQDQAYPTQAYTTPADMLPLDETPLPYADPAYAESHANGNVESMESARPGVFKSKKGKKAKKVKTPKAAKSSNGASTLLTPRNKRLGAMVAAVGVMSLVASQTVFKPANDPTLQDPFGAPLPIAENSNNDGSQTLSVDGNLQTVPSIGDYADNKAPALDNNAAAGTALERAAQSGDAIAQLQLGLSKLEMGETEEAVALIRLAANQDQPAALYRLAKLYEAGQGVGTDLDIARTLTERAAKGGNRIAMHDLALYSAEGRGGAKMDMTAAAYWFQEAAQRGVVDSQFNLGVLFESGQGVPVDPKQAFYWYSVAAGQGDQTAAARVAILKTELPEAIVSEATSKVAAFKPRQIDALANGIFKNMPWGETAKTSSNASVDAKQTIAKTQTLLSDLGYDVGAPDGAIGPKTRSAIISFERANGLPETGRVNAGLIDRLELAAGT
ncbi:peptidoglycan-binding protein [Fretibacter rubidus]|uniref:peptidoglycan-binding protein n=1 Tax=Fretibacter rubidus TaxID=570162 RepID=UPI00352B3B41